MSRQISAKTVSVRANRIAFVVLSVGLILAHVAWVAWDLSRHQPTVSTYASIGLIVLFTIALLCLPRVWKKSR